MTPCKGDSSLGLGQAMPPCVLAREPGFSCWGPARLPGRRDRDIPGGFLSGLGALVIWMNAPKDRIYQEKKKKKKG